MIRALGEKVFLRGLPVFEQSWPKTLPAVLVHNDLSPQNILFTNSGFVAIDWDTAQIAPASVDWAAVWMFACQKPDWAEQIYQLAIKRLGPKEKKEVDSIFLLYGYRLLAYYAETYLYALRVGNRFQALNKTVLEAGQNMLEKFETRI